VQCGKSGGEIYIVLKPINNDSSLEPLLINIVSDDAQLEPLLIFYSLISSGSRYCTHLSAMILVKNRC
jgi:hypothetical protein